MDNYPLKRTKPAIHIYSGAKSELLDCKRVISALISGMEEEEIPSYLAAYTPQEAEVLSFQAAHDSALGVGMGIGADLKISLHYVKMPVNRPIFILAGRTSGIDEIRDLGGNAAKLVKGYPLKI